MKQLDKRTIVLLYLLGCVPVLWFALILGMSLNGNLFDIMNSLSTNMSNPFHIEITKNTGRSILLCLIAYGMGIAIYYSTKKNYRRNEEHGSAKWGNVFQLANKYEDKNSNNNKILTQNFSISFNQRKHLRNLHVLVIGGSGAGKTRCYAKVNIMQCNSSFVVLDPKGEILRSTGNLLEKEGYVVKVLDLIKMERSLCYNPFAYLHDDNDVLKLITNLIRNTTPKGSQSMDPFWEKSETALLLALCLFLHHEAPPEEQNFGMVMEMIAAADVKEDDEDYVSPLDELFTQLENRNPDSLAVKQYHIYKQAAGKTAKSILISVGVRLAAFNLSSLSGVTTTDELELEKMGERKTALFAVIPDNDSSFNFIVGMLYTQLFQQLYYQADYIYHGALPVHVHFVMDEFANVALPDEFDKLLSTMRSREISVSIILQNLAQIKALYKDNWESIVGNCDEMLYLGGNEQSTYEYVSKRLGKETIDTNTYGMNRGRNGSYTTNYQQSGRELLMPDEVGLINIDEALLFVRSEKPICDKKFDILKHKNIKYTTDGGGEPYVYGIVEKDIDWRTIELNENGNYELLSEEDLEEEFNKENE